MTLHLGGTSDARMRRWCGFSPWDAMRACNVRYDPPALIVIIHLLLHAGRRAATYSQLKAIRVFLLHSTRILSTFYPIRNENFYIGLDGSRRRGRSALL